MLRWLKLLPSVLLVLLFAFNSFAWSKSSLKSSQQGKNRYIQAKAAVVHKSLKKLNDPLQTAQALYKDFDKKPQKQRYRHHWIKVIAALEAAVLANPKHAQVPQALLLQAELWARLHALSGRSSDLHQALVVCDRLQTDYPQSPLSPQALWQKAQLLLTRSGDKAAAAQTVSLLINTYPKSTYAKKARLLAPTLPKVGPFVLAPHDRHNSSSEVDNQPKGPLFGRHDDKHQMAQVLSVRTWSNPEYSRVVVYLSAPAEARLGVLPADANQQLGHRLYMDIAAAEPAAQLKLPTQVDDPLLQKVRLAVRDKHVVRVVLDLKKAAVPRLLVMENPYRLVLDATRSTPTPLLPTNTQAPSVAKRRVVLDPGHGGMDAGAVGVFGVREKDVVLKIGLKARDVLQKAGVETLLTRSDDTFVSLEERTAMANRLQAEIFVSIHANAAPRVQARGIETYYLNVTDNRYSLRLAAVENKTSEEQVSDLQLILADLSTKANTQQSKGLASLVQRSMFQHARKKNPQTRDLGVKASLFYVLLGARMPAVLVETSFLSNPLEARFLSRADYQQDLGNALAAAILQYLRTPLNIVEHS